VSFAQTEKSLFLLSDKKTLELICKFRWIPSTLLIVRDLLTSKMILVVVVFHHPVQRRKVADFGDLRLVMIDDGSCRL
jgi:hypothetical protein